MINLKYILVFFFISSINSILAQKSVVIQQSISNYHTSIYLPKGYDSVKPYKVIYVNDGQWLFNSRSLDLRQKLDSLINLKVINPVIVVGIHSDANRTINYVPYKIKDVPSFNSRAKKYADDLTKKIIPFIDQQYNTIKHRDGRAIFGFSFGGLNATWLTIYYSNIFSFSAGFSPSFWVADYQLIKDVSLLKTKTTFWFDIGTNEWNYYIPFIKKAKQKGGIYGRSIFYYEVPKGEHTIKDWKNRITYPIILFSGKEKGIIKNWSIEIEVIKSKSKPGVFYQRLNPIVILNNGIRYSLADQAKYVLLNKKDGKVFDDGRFHFLKQKDLNVLVTYQKLKKEITIKHKEILTLKK
ncbi:MAG: hypothetical protein JXQ93_13050 [Flavobacteriaceae bacterium]